LIRDRELGVETDINLCRRHSTLKPVQPNRRHAPRNSKIDWFGTLRERAGYLVIKYLLLYATGGLAYAGVEHAER